MPQMSPMWWMTMMMMIMLLMKTMNSIIYFYMPSIKMNKKQLKKKMMNWKW
nr:ATP synthase F0 subunit 8 [Xestocephalus sp. 'geminusanulus']